MIPLCQGRGVAGLDRTGVLLALARENADAFVGDFDDLKRELERG